MLADCVARMAGELRHRYRSRGKALTLADALIGALAIAHHLVLLTDNVKDYPMPELRVERP
ncbi:MAG: hypothetical protein HYV03_08755 [Deltaproteobacteria bacterium]|nr:hypothetical protein [Deltaproteobacteria bacterium]